MIEGESYMAPSATDILAANDDALSYLSLEGSVADIALGAQPSTGDAMIPVAAREIPCIESEATEPAFEHAGAGATPILALPKAAQAETAALRQELAAARALAADATEKLAVAEAVAAAANTARNAAGGVEIDKRLEEMQARVAAAEAAAAAAEEARKANEATVAVAMDQKMVELERKLAAAEAAAAAAQQGLQLGKPTPTVETLFQLLDKNGDGHLTKEEVVTGAVLLSMTPDEAAKLFDELDDGSGELKLGQLGRFAAVVAEGFDEAWFTWRMYLEHTTNGPLMIDDTPPEDNTPVATISAPVNGNPITGFIGTVLSPFNASEEAKLLTVDELFVLLDVNGSGQLTRDEVVSAADKLNLTQEEAALLFDEMNTDYSGTLTRNALSAFVDDVVSELKDVGVSLVGLISATASMFGLIDDVDSVDSEADALAAKKRRSCSTPPDI